MKSILRARVLVTLFFALATGALGWAYRRWVWGAADGDLAWVHAAQTYVLRDPRWLAPALVAPLLIWVSTRTLADLPLWQRGLALVLRASFVGLLALSLARLSRTHTTQDVCTVFLVDVSDSVTDAAIGDARDAIRATLRHRKPRDTARFITFAERPRLVEAPEHPTDVPVLSRHDADGTTHHGAGTDLQAALQLAYGLYPSGFLRHAVLFSDGLPTRGDLLAEARRARGLGVTLFTYGYSRPVPPEVAVERLVVPDRVAVGEPFEVVAEVYASRPASVRAELYQGEALNGLDGVRSVELAAGRSTLPFRSVVRVAGEVTYRFRLVVSQDDKFAENNEIAASLYVPGRPSVLYVEGEAGRSTALASGLEKQGFDVDVRSPSAMPASLRELERFDMLVLSDVSAEQLPESAQMLVESYLREVGGGLLFAGGPNSYGPGGFYHSTMERILPVRMDAERRKDQPSVAMSLVIDRSGSMTGVPLEMAKQAARATLDTLAPDDLIEVIAFDSVPTRYVKMQPARNRSRISGDIARVQAGGGTEIFPALDAAYQDLSVVEARKKHVILLTDGRASSGGIRDLVQAMAAESITVTTVGLGAEVDDQLLSMIKDFGGGRYHKVPDPNSLPKIFTREAEIVAKSAVSVDYFPVRVTSPADFLRGLDLGTAPLLSGYTATKLKPPPAQQVLSHGDRDDPILARWRVGLGYALAWTSDVKPRWAAEWTRWPAWPQFWGQLMREHMRKRSRTELPMTVEVVSGRGRAIVDAFTPDDRFDNGLVSTLVVEGPLGGRTAQASAKPMAAPSAATASPREADNRQATVFRQTAPGRYEAEFVLRRYGSFVLRADHKRRTADGALASAAVSYGHVSYPYPEEYARFEADLPLLEQAAVAAAGARDPAPERVFDAGTETVSSYEDLWPRLVAVSVVLLLLDVLSRRVRIWERKTQPARAA